MKKTQTTCAYCGVGCGIKAWETEGTVHIEGDPAHPANFGKLCSKGLALGETLEFSSRLASPIIDGEIASWDDATSAIANRLTSVINDHGPDAVAFYVSGQLLTEDYYIANKLMKGFIGSANIDTNSRLCMSSAVAAHKRAFGEDIVPCTYEDLEEADLVVLTGSNLAWCHPVLFQRLKKAKEKCGTKIVVIDPRRTESCDIADLHVPIMPGGDVLLFNGLLAHLNDHGLTQNNFTAAHVEGLEEALTTARADQEKLLEAAHARGIADQVSQFFELFRNTKKTVTVFSMGINQAHNGTDRANAIINAHLATGRIGKAGMGPFSMTGQPNAMGGREVGGLANMLAAHMDFSPETISRVQRFWKAPNIASTEGKRAVDMFDAVYDGRIKAIWIMGTNPAVSLPNSNKVREALSRCPNVIVSDCVHDTDTQKYADIRLPAAPWSEKDGTVTNSDRTISHQRAFRPLYAQTRPDWHIIRDVAHAMGWQQAFDYNKPADIFREHAALTAFENNNNRLLNLCALKDLDDNAYEALKSVRWPLIDTDKATTRPFADGQFYTKNRKARMMAVSHTDGTRAKRPDELLLNTGRYRDQWHTMTRTGLSHRLMGHRPEPLLEINPVDAKLFDIEDGGFAFIKNQQGTMICRVLHSTSQQSGEIFLPMHWGETHAKDAGVGKLIAPVVDAVSSQPAFKATAVTISPARMTWRAILLTRERLMIDSADYRTLAQLEHAHLTRLAGTDFKQLNKIAKQIQALEGDCISFGDAAKQHSRTAIIQDGQLKALLIAGPQLGGVQLDWLQHLFKKPIQETDRQLILAGRPPGKQEDKGPIVCACLQIGRSQITKAILEDGNVTHETLGEKLGAGTGCGSCIPELKQLIQKSRVKETEYVT